MQGTTRAAAGRNGEVLLAGFDHFLLVGAGNGVLEAGGVGGVARDGHANALVPHDGNAFADVISAVALDLGAFAVGIGDFLDDRQRMVFLHVSRQVVILGLHIGEAVDAADDHGSVLAQTVQDDAQGVLANLVGIAGNADSAFRGSKGFVASEEREALGLLVQQHRAQIAVAQTNLTLVSDGTGDAERLQTFADAGGRFRSGLNALLQRDGSAQLAFSKQMG